MWAHLLKRDASVIPLAKHYTGATSLKFLIVDVFGASVARHVVLHDSLSVKQQITCSAFMDLFQLAICSPVLCCPPVELSAASGLVRVVTVVCLAPEFPSNFFTTIVFSLREKKEEKRKKIKPCAAYCIMLVSVSLWGAVE